MLQVTFDGKDEEGEALMGGGLRPVIVDDDMPQLPEKSSSLPTKRTGTLDLSCRLRNIRAQMTPGEMFATHIHGTSSVPFPSSATPYRTLDFDLAN